MAARKPFSGREPFDSYYEVLGVPEDADQETIRSAYRRLCNQVHPDKGGSNALFRKVADAYATLSDPAKREAYDRFLHSPSTSTPPGPRRSDYFRDDGYATGGEPGYTSEDEDLYEDDDFYEEDDLYEDDDLYDDPAAPGWVRVDAESAWGSDHTGAAYEQYPSDGLPARSGLSRYFHRHPAGFLTLAGFAVYVLGGAIGPASGTSVALAGILLLVLGLVAMGGGRRLKSRPALNGLPEARAGFPLLRAELAAGFHALGRALLVVAGAVFLASLVSGGRSNQRHRRYR